MKKYTKKEITDFLDESNKIEGVYDSESLRQAETAWEFLEKQKDLTPDIILKTHKILMLHHKLLPNEKGYFRRVPVYVGGREGAKYKDIPMKINSWITSVSDTIKASILSAISEERIQEDHVYYEEIHPFVDGNGRTGRMFMNWERMQVGLSIKIIYEKERSEYYKWFK